MIYRRSEAASRGAFRESFLENIQQIYRRTPMPKWSNFIEITVRYGCSPVNFLHIFRTHFLKNTSARLPLQDFRNITKYYKVFGIRRTKEQIEILAIRFTLLLIIDFTVNSALGWRCMKVLITPFSSAYVTLWSWIKFRSPSLSSDIVER